MQTKKLWRGIVILILGGRLSGCVVTELATMPLRVVGASLSLVGAVVSVVPVVGDSVDEALESVDSGIDTAADSIDKVPL